MKRPELKWQREWMPSTISTMKFGGLKATGSYVGVFILEEIVQLGLSDLNN